MPTAAVKKKKKKKEKGGDRSIDETTRGGKVEVREERKN